MSHTPSQPNGPARDENLEISRATMMATAGSTFAAWATFSVAKLTLKVTLVLGVLGLLVDLTVGFKEELLGSQPKEKDAQVAEVSSPPANADSRKPKGKTNRQPNQAPARSYSDDMEAEKDTSERQAREPRIAEIRNVYNAPAGFSWSIICSAIGK